MMMHDRPGRDRCRPQLDLYKTLINNDFILGRIYPKIRTSYWWSYKNVLVPSAFVRSEALGGYDLLISIFLYLNVRFIDVHSPYV